MSKRIPFGPSLTGTVVTPDIDATVAAYRDYLHAAAVENTEVSAALATLWGKPRLAGSPLVTLQSPSGVPWVRFIGCPDVPRAKPFQELGWMAMEVLVQDVSELAQQLLDSPFDIIRAPPDPGGRAEVRAMQVAGPAGEVLYLTEIERPVPPFDIGPAQSPVDRLFTPVCACLRRDESLAVYSKLGARDSWSFETPIGSVNRAHGLDASLRHPVATVQLSGQSMVEINQLGVTKARPPTGGLLPGGIVIVSFLVDNLDNIGLQPISPPQQVGGMLYTGRRVAACRGAAGELLELIEAG
jgi:hypothetical protein